jgi:hypothetical protein
MIDINYYYQMVENFIASIGVDPSQCRGNTPGQWSLYRGSALVYVDLWHIEKENRAYIQCMSPVMPLPEMSLQGALFQELLEINDKLYGVGFTLYNGHIWLKHIREVDGLDANEAAAIMNRIGIYADQYDDYLKQKYGLAPPPPTSEGGGHVSA